jgi:hypothetical protein
MQETGSRAHERASARSPRLAYMLAIGWVIVCLGLYAFQALNLVGLVG